VMKYIQS